MTGDITGDITGNVTGDVTANQITVGDKFINSSGVGLGTTSTVGRNAGINTAIGTLIYNADSDKTEVYGSQGWSQVGGVDYVEATGGTVTEVVEGSVRYNVHTFNSTEDFVVVSVNNRTCRSSVSTCRWRRRRRRCRGNGNGFWWRRRWRTYCWFDTSWCGTYTVTVGAGGNGGACGISISSGVDGGSTTISGPDITTITASGGGAGASGADGPLVGSSGGSGGGGGAYSGLAVQELLDKVMEEELQYQDHQGTQITPTILVEVAAVLVREF